MCKDNWTRHLFLSSLLLALGVFTLTIADQLKIVLHVLAYGIILLSFGFTFLAGTIQSRGSYAPLKDLRKHETIRVHSHVQLGSYVYLLVELSKPYTMRLLRFDNGSNQKTFLKEGYYYRFDGKSLYALAIGNS